MTIIAGNRRLNSYVIVKQVIEEARQTGFVITRVLEGDGGFTDEHARVWAMAHNIPHETIPADWDNLHPADDMGIPVRPTQAKNLSRWYDAAAGPRRNTIMALQEIQIDNQLIAVLVKGQPNKGTRNMIKIAKAHGLTVFQKEVDYNGNGIR